MPSKSKDMILHIRRLRVPSRIQKTHTHNLSIFREQEKSLSPPDFMSDASAIIISQSDDRGWDSRLCHICPLSCQINSLSKDRVSCMCTASMGFPFGLVPIHRSRGGLGMWLHPGSPYRDKHKVHTVPAVGTDALSKNRSWVTVGGLLPGSPEIIHKHRCPKENFKKDASSLSD